MNGEGFFVIAAFPHGCHQTLDMRQRGSIRY